MKHMLKWHQGFALPTILIASVIMLTVLMSAITAVSSITGGINSQYYNQLAREAAESGLANAEMCLRGSSYTPTWTDAAPLKPDVDCNGAVIGGASKWIVNTTNTRTTFTVGLPTVGASSSLRIVAVGTVELLRTSDPTSPWRTYTTAVAKTSRYNDMPQIGGGAGWKTTGHLGYFLSSTGSLYAWGDNSGQQIGDTTLGTSVKIPVQVVLPSGVARVKKIYGSGQGASILCIIGSDDQAYCRGQPGLGEAGLMPLTPGWYKFTLPGALTAQDLSLSGYGFDGACVLASNAQAYCAGENNYGTLGYGNNSATIVPLTNPQQFALTAAGAGLQAAKVYIKDGQTCVLATDSRAYCAGFNNVGQLGRGNTTANPQGVAATPAKVLVPGDPVISDIRMTSHGPFNALFYLTVGGLYMSGNATQGTAIDGTTSATIYSTPRSIFTGNFVKILSIGEEGTTKSSICALAGDRNAPESGIWCAGQNKFGQIGSGTCSAVSPQTTWHGMLNLGGETVLRTMSNSVDYQMNSVMVITTAGNVWAWGDNAYGKLGTGAAYGTCNPTPQKVQLPAGVKAVDLANGDEYTSYILTDNGKVYAMGRNNNGQLGDGTTTDRNVPVEVKIPRQETIY